MALELDIAVVELVDCIGFELEDTAPEPIGLLELELEMDLKVGAETIVVELDIALAELAKCVDLELDERALELVNLFELELGLDVELT